jgi:uncharacterized membrane protein
MIYLALFQSVLLCASTIHAALDKYPMGSKVLIGPGSALIASFGQWVVALNFLVLLMVVVLIRIAKRRSLIYVMPATLLATAVV